MSYNDGMPQSGLEVNGHEQLPDFVFTSLYPSIIHQIIQERRPAQIALSLGITPQNLNNRLQRLAKHGVIIEGNRTSYREWSVPSWVQDEVKRRNGGVIKMQTFQKQVCVHHISAGFLIVNETATKIGGRIKRLRSEQYLCKINHDGLVFNVVQTTNNIFVRFPQGFRLTFLDVNGLYVLRTIHDNIYQIAGEVMKKVREMFPDLVVTRSHKSCHYAFKDKVARTLTQRGIRMTVEVGKKRAGIDASPHFTPRGEIEVYDEESAYIYLSFMLNLPRYMPVLEALAKWMDEGKDPAALFEKAAADSISN